MTPDAYYRVPAFTAKAITVERGGRLGLTLRFLEVEETAFDHGSAAVFGLIVFALGAQLVPGALGFAIMVVGGFFAGYAANNALIAWRCERRENGGAGVPDRSVLPNGGEIHFNDPEKDCHVPDRIRFLPGGFVMGVYKRQYEIIVYPPDEVRRIHTYTKHLEDEDWWDGEPADA